MNVDRNPEKSQQCLTPGHPHKLQAFSHPIALVADISKISFMLIAVSKLS